MSLHQGVEVRPCVVCGGMGGHMPECYFAASRYLQRHDVRPRLLDAYCGAGGAAKGYYDAGFDVLGIDKEPQPNYPYDFIQCDALQALASPLFMSSFDAVHASPPCQARSDLQKLSKLHYDELVPATRELLLETGLPYVIENVESTTEVAGAQLIDPVVLCGTMFPGLRVLRHRLFESNFPIRQPGHGKTRYVGFYLMAAVKTRERLVQWKEAA